MQPKIMESKIRKLEDDIERQKIMEKCNLDKLHTKYNDEIILLKISEISSREQLTEHISRIQKLEEIIEQLKLKINLHDSENIPENDVKEQALQDKISAERMADKLRHELDYKSKESEAQIHFLKRELANQITERKKNDYKAIFLGDQVTSLRKENQILVDRLKSPKFNSKSGNLEECNRQQTTLKGKETAECRCPNLKEELTSLRNLIKDKEVEFRNEIETLQSDNNVKSKRILYLVNELKCAKNLNESTDNDEPKMMTNHRVKFDVFNNRINNEFSRMKCTENCDCVDLESKVSKLLLEKEQLQQRLAEGDDERLEINKRITNLVRDKSELASRLMEINENSDEEKRSFQNRMELVHQQLKDEITDVQKKYEELIGTVSEKEKLCGNLNQNISEVNQQLLASIEKYDLLHEKYENCQRYIGELEGQNNATKCSLDQQKNENNQTIDEIRSLKQKYAEAIASLEKVKKREAEISVSTEDQIQANCDERTISKAEIDDYRLNSLRDKFGNAKFINSDEKCSNIAQLKRREPSTDEDNRELQSRPEVCCLNMCDVTNDNLKLEKEVNRIKDSYRSQIIELEKQKECLKQHVVELKLELQFKDMEKCASSEAAYEDMNQTCKVNGEKTLLLDESLFEKDLINTRMEKVEGLNDELKFRIESLLADKSNLLSENNNLQAKIESYRHQISICDNKISKIKGKFAMHRQQKHNVLDRMKQRHLCEMKNLQREIESMKIKEDCDKRVNEDLRKRFDRLTQVIKDSRDNLTQLEARNAHSSSKLIEKDLHIESIEKELSVIRTAHQNLILRCQDLEKEILEMKILETRSKKVDGSTSISVLLDCSKELKRAVDSLPNNLNKSSKDSSVCHVRDERNHRFTHKMEIECLRFENSRLNESFRRVVNARCRDDNREIEEIINNSEQRASSSLLSSKSSSVSSRRVICSPSDSTFDLGSPTFASSPIKNL